MFRRTVLVLAIAVAGGALAHEGASGIIAERMTAMKNIGQELKAIGDMVLGTVPFDAAAVEQHAAKLHENCHEMEEMFPAGSIDHHSRARPEIWQKPQEFKIQMERLHNASEALVASAALRDISKVRASFEEVRDTCSNCHDGFRMPEH